MMASWKSPGGFCSEASAGRSIVAGILLVKSAVFLALFGIVLSDWDEYVQDPSYIPSFLLSVWQQLLAWIGASIFRDLVVFWTVWFAVETAAAGAALMMELCPASSGRCLSHGTAWTVLVILEIPNLLLGLFIFIAFMYTSVIVGFEAVTLVILLVSLAFCCSCITTCCCCCRIPKSASTVQIYVNQ